jgi:uncharacterized protein (DUF1800 family)
MDHRNQVAHLCRRVGFGVTLEDRERYASMPIEKVKDDLLDFERASTFPIHPFETLFNEQGEFQNQPGRISAWWTLRMTFGDTPAKDKLLVFLHDHFAVSAEKVESPLLMLVYLETLEANIAQPFDQLLKAMTGDPAMMLWLDLNTSVRGRPNENYARELLELFTLGVDNGYTERDVQEAARALTGWSVRSALESPSAAVRRTMLLQYVREGRPYIGGAFAEALHDPGPHEILGEKKRFDAALLCEKLASDRRTATALSKKLWEFYAYPNPSKAVLDRTTDTFIESKGRLPVVVRSIVDSKEFWSEQAERALVKSPIDFLVPMVRQLISKETVFSLRDPNADIDTPLPAALLNLAVSLPTLTNRMGMLPLYPPDVDGWSWGPGWISSATMFERIKMSDVFTNQGRGRSASTRLNEVAASRSLTTNEELVRALFEILDVPADVSAMTVMVGAAAQVNLAGAIGDLDRTSAALRPMLRVLFAMPAFHTV